LNLRNSLKQELSKYEEQTLKEMFTHYPPRSKSRAYEIWTRFANLSNPLFHFFTHYYVNYMYKFGVRSRQTEIYNYVFLINKTWILVLKHETLRTLSLKWIKVGWHEAKSSM